MGIPFWIKFNFRIITRNVVTELSEHITMKKSEIDIAMESIS